MVAIERPGGYIETAAVKNRSQNPLLRSRGQQHEENRFRLLNQDREALAPVSAGEILIENDDGDPGCIAVLHCVIESTRERNPPTFLDRKDPKIHLRGLGCSNGHDGAIQTTRALNCAP